MRVRKKAKKNDNHPTGQITVLLVPPPTQLRNIIIDKIINLRISKYSQ